MSILENPNLFANQVITILNSEPGDFEEKVIVTNSLLLKEEFDGFKTEVIAKLTNLGYNASFDGNILTVSFGD